MCLLCVPFSSLLNPFRCQRKLAADYYFTSCSIYSFAPFTSRYQILCLPIILLRPCLAGLKAGAGVMTAMLCSAMQSKSCS